MDMSAPDCDNRGSLRWTVENTTKPIVLKNCLEKWACLKYTFGDWARLFEGKLLKFRCGKKSSMNQGVFQWERECVESLISFEDFVKWQASGKPLQPQGNKASLLNQFSCEEAWAYYDYKYMDEAFRGEDSVLKDIDWGGCGFPDRDGRHSTLWMGSTGAFTPCHYDTYGFNLVAQLYGKKRWLLYPPEDGIFLEPSRIPYEESSVYSRINFNLAGNNLESIGGTPYVVTLEPGDVLVVPRQWWHYVENMETSVSINTWVELPEDKSSRLHEALVKFVVGNVVKNVPENFRNSLLNPNEDDLNGLGLEELLKYIRISAVDEQLNLAEQRDEPAVAADEARSRVTIVPVPEMDVTRSAKKRKTESISFTSNSIKRLDSASSVTELSSRNVPKVSYVNKPDAEVLISADDDENVGNRSLLSLVTDSMCHPDVISKVADIIRSKLTSDNFTLKGKL